MLARRTADMQIGIQIRVTSLLTMGCALLA